MSEDKNKPTEGKLGKLISMARDSKNKAQSPEKPNQSHADDLELDLTDPTKGQETPPELHDPLEREDPLELDAEGESKESSRNPLRNLTLGQRIMLIGVLGIIFVGGKNIFSGDTPSMAELNQGLPQEQSKGPRETSEDVTDSNGLQPIDQGMVAPDANAVNVLPDSEFASVEESDELVSLTPPEGPDAPDAEQIANPTSPDKMLLSASDDPLSGQIESTGDFSTEGDDLDSSTSEGTFDEYFASGDMAEPSPPPTDAPQAASASISNEIVTLRNEIEELSHFVSSIESGIQSSSRSNEELADQVATLMAELKQRDRQLDDLADRPEVTDLVIFTAAANCSTCVPHALFRWNGKEHEVGDGLSWNGFQVAIRGDRMSLVKDQDQFHYWYR